MTKISIDLSTDYKSFKQGTYELEGDLIVLTGVNGSGKSQFFETMTRVIPSFIKLKRGEKEVEPIDAMQTLYKSFKDLIRLNSIKSENPDYLANTAKQIWDSYVSHINGQSFYMKYQLLNFMELTGKSYFKNIQEVADELQKLENYTLVDFDFFNFENISDLFLFYIYKRTEYCRKNGNKTGDEAKAKFEKEDPRYWGILNREFKKFNFDYKFADDYESVSGHIKGGVKLLDQNNQPLPFGVESLSDGEIAIFSLVVASMKMEIDNILPKILLLDEYDATFNPSLTEVFYSILSDFFIKKGVVVILATHNPITATFAPKIEGYTTSFYEINKPNSGKARIEKKDSHEFDEVKKVLKLFYPQVQGFEKEIEELKKNNKPQIYCEGKTDFKYLKAGLEYFRNLPDKDKPSFVDIIEDDFFQNNADFYNENKSKDQDGAGDMKILGFLTKVRSSGIKNKIIAIFDNDNLSMKFDGIKSANIKPFKIPIPEFRKSKGQELISIEYLFHEIDNSIFLEIEGKKKTLFLGSDFDKNGRHKAGNFYTIERSKVCKDIIIEDNVFYTDCTKDHANVALTKNDFADAVLDERIPISSESWENFRPIFEKIESFLNQP